MRRLQSGESAPAAKAALDTLCTLYWEPVRRYLRALGCPEGDVADVTQEFFATFLRRGGFERADPALAKLRTFIKLAAGNFLANHWRNRAALKRGGGVTHENLDDLPELAAEKQEEAGMAYDREWAEAVLDRALAKVAADYATRGRTAVFEAVKGGLLRAGSLPDPGRVAADLGVSEPQVRLAVHRARQRLAEALREEVACTVETPAEVEDEVRYLVGVLARTR